MDVLRACGPWSVRCAWRHRGERVGAERQDGQESPRILLSSRFNGYKTSYGLTVEDCRYQSEELELYLGGTGEP